MDPKTTTKERMVLVPSLMPQSLIDAEQEVVVALGYKSRAAYRRDALREKIARTHPHLVDASESEQAIAA